MTKMWLLLLRLFIIVFLSPRVPSLFLFNFRGAPRIDFHLSMFSLTISILASLFSESLSLAGETKTILLEKATLGEENSYPKPVLSEATL